MKRVMALVVLGSLLCVLPGSTDAAPADSARLRNMLNRLKSTQINVTFEDTALSEVLELIGRFTNVNIIVRLNSVKCEVLR